ncbi:uncharacterized protein LOC110725738 isoform X2 [Chenopodium quinoa]|uniref:uncharacterized protein LOC110725738 isoform X2 n=1 Tax=Chenopodium quinoa TaxID=63459 RepID=UPI000B79160A|nr:uncharacterized protein LOC110725738 isoform X2 [Chenopodium quinoa]
MNHHNNNHHHHYRHHQQPWQQQHHHQHPQLIDSPRYLPPPPPLPPPSFPDDHPHHFPPPPQRHLPPPPPPHNHNHHHHHPLSPRLVHHPPPPSPPPSHHSPIETPFNFINSPPHQYHHNPHQQPHLHHRRLLEDEHRDGFRSPTRVIPPNHYHHVHNHNHHGIDDVDVENQLRFRVSQLPPPPPLPPMSASRVSPMSDSRVSPMSPGVCRSPTQFVHRVRREIESPPRFREELGLESRVRVHHSDGVEYQLRRDRERDRERGDERRVLGVFDRLEGDFGRDHREFEHHEKYYPEMMPARKEIELNSGSSECRRGSLNDEGLVRGGRDDVVLEENVNMRRGSGGGGGSREVSRSPIKFRIGGVEVDDKGSNRGRNEEVQEYSNRGTPKKNVQKKSAFLRIQPGKPQQQHSSSFRNRFDKNNGSNKTPSPHKGKESNSESLDCRVSEERVRNPVELDVSFKSNALVAKPIMAAPSCSGVECNVNNSLTDLGVRIDGDSLPKVGSLTDYSSVSKREEKDIKNRVRVSSIMKRLGSPNNLEVHGSRSELSSGGSISVSGGITSKADSKGEVLGRVNKKAGLDNVSTRTARKKRKANSPISRLSRSVSIKTDSGLVNVDCSANRPSDVSMPSDVSVKNLETKSSCGGNVIDSTQNILVDMGKFEVSKSSAASDQREVLGHPVTEASDSSKRIREIGMSEHLPGSPGSLRIGFSDGHGNMEGMLQDEQKISNPDEDVTKLVEKFISDVYIEKDSVKDQDMAPVLVINNGSEEGSSELVIRVGDNVDSNDNCRGNVDTLDFVENMSSVSIPANVSKKENIVDLSCPLTDAVKSCEDQVFSSPENATIGLSLGSLYSDRNHEPESKYSEDYEKLESFSIDVCSDKRTSLSYNDDVTVSLEHVKNSASDVRDTNDIQEEHCQGSETMLVNDDTTLGKEDNSKTCVDAGGVLAVPVNKDSSQLNRKRKSKTEPNSLDSRISESCQLVVNLSFPIENATHPVEKHSSAVSGSACVESDIAHGNEIAGSCLKGMNSMNHPPDLDLIEHSSSFGKKRKVYPLESVFSDAPEFESSDLPVSGKLLTPVADEPSTNHSPQFSERFELQKSVITGKGAADRAASNLCAETCSLADNSISDFLCTDSCLSITESTPPDVEQSNLPESGCHQKVDKILMTAGADDGNGLNTLTTIERKSNLQCLPGDHTRDAEQGSLAMNLDFDGAIALNSNLSSLSGCLQSHAESTDGGVTANFDMLDTPSNSGLTEACSLLPSSLNTSIASPVIHVTSGEKLCKDDKKSSKPFAKQSSITSQANLLPESRKKSSKPGISATSGVQPFAQKGVLMSSKQEKTTKSSSNFMIRQRKNVLTRSEASPSTSHLSAVIKPSKSQTFPVKPRTWHRTSNLTANIPAKKPSGGIPPPHRALSSKAVKVQDTSYIRKGNSLVRNPISGASTSGSLAVGASTSGSLAVGATIDRPRPNKTDKISKIVGSVMIESTGLPDGLVKGGRNAPIEMPKTPPLPCSSKTSDNDAVYSGQCVSSLHVDHSVGTDSEEALKSPDVALNSLMDPESAVNRNLEDPVILSDGDLVGSNSEKMIYVKHKLNQLIAALKSSQSSLLNTDKGTATSSDVNYFKRRKNQLIRASSDGNIQQLAVVNKDNPMSVSQRAFHASSGRSFTKRLSNKVKSTKFSLVWKLGESKSCGKGVDSMRSRRLLSHLLPWKRATYWSRKLLSSKKRGAVYVRSSRGFSLRRSKVISLPGTSLKWSKSMEKRSKKVGEEAAKAVAAMNSVQKSGSLQTNSKAGERIFRIGVFRYRMDPSRRTLQRISDEEASDFTASKTDKDVRKTYVPKRLIIGSDEYVRIGNGNQLVRDPKRRTRILASEKVRWSLHTARMRLAKKRKFCQFFTRFGKCNKGEGKCSFIHDPSKIAVCTKFLKGLCADLDCKLTHKVYHAMPSVWMIVFGPLLLNSISVMQVIPERMPDCSFFLQGLCSNEKCPYRHVNVNPKASICESFLRGYCAEGNECRKKHSYICPEFEASGSCPQGSKCKLYHPKKGKTKKRKGQRDQKNAKGRYFGSGLSVVVDPETKPIMLKNHAEPNKVSSALFQGDLGDFVSLDVSDDEAQEDGPTSDHTLSEDGPQNSQLDDFDELIKPLRLLGRL